MMDADAGASPLDDSLYSLGRHRMPGPPLSRAFLTRRGAAHDLLLVRHGHQLIPPGPLTAADFRDPPLSERGERQAKAVAAVLGRFGVETLYSSDMIRARQTAAEISAAIGVPVTAELPELREIDMYSELAAAEETMTPSDGWRAGLPELFVRTRRWGAFPHGETSEAFRGRVTASVEGILALSGDRNVAVVCHGGVINAYLADLLGVTEDMVFQPAHCSITWLRHASEGRRAIHSLNLVEHLLDGDLLTY